MAMYFVIALFALNYNMGNCKYEYGIRKKIILFLVDLDTRIDPFRHPFNAYYLGKNSRVA